LVKQTHLLCWHGAEHQRVSDNRPSCHHTVAFGGYPRWQGSEAEALLKIEIDDGEHMKMKPEELHKTRKEYEDFLLTVFRKHIYQAIRSCKDTAYHLAKKEKKNQKK